MNEKCKVCGQDMQVEFIPKGRIFLWKYPKGIKSDWVNERKFTLGSDWKLNRDLKHLFCSCGYSKYEEITR